MTRPPAKLPAPDHQFGPGSVPGKLTRGWRKRELIHALARKERTQTQLARHYGVGTSAVSQFKKRHAAAIKAVEDDIENEFAGLWIADKKARLAEYEADVEGIIAKDALVDELVSTITAIDDPEERTKLIEQLEVMASEGPAWARIKHQALRAVADELGQIPAKMTLLVDSTVTHVVIEGVELEALE